MNTQKGSAHAIIIIGLIVLLLGALGFIFWQQTSKDSQGRVETKQASPESDKDDTKKTYTNDELGFSFQYPNDWVLTDDAGGVTLTSPDTKSGGRAGINSPDNDISLTIEKKSGAVGGSSSVSIGTLKADQNGEDTSNYASQKYTETINSIAFTEFDMVADPSYFTAVFPIKDSYVAVDFLTAENESALSEAAREILTSFKKN